MFYIVRYSGPFGFIKPWSAVRDSVTFSQPFLTPSIIEGLRQKPGVSSILRNKLSYGFMAMQSECTQSRDWLIMKLNKKAMRFTSIIERGVMVEPVLLLAFPDFCEANKASKQNICLCRNEDILFPEPEILQMTEKEFNQLDGFELKFEEGDDSLMVGYNRFENQCPMYGKLEITGEPIRSL